MIKVINDLAAQSEIILPGIDEGETLVGTRDPEAIADFYLNNSDITKTVIVKLGSEGIFAEAKDGETFTLPSFKAPKVVDTVGAGDGFAAGFITGQLEGLSLRESARRGNVIGSLAVQAPGDNDGYPTPEELKEFLANH